jgi:hypothetical protein
LEKALVRRVKRRMLIRIVRFWRSTNDVEICQLTHYLIAAAGVAVESQII